MRAAIFSGPGRLSWARWLVCGLVAGVAGAAPVVTRVTPPPDRYYGDRFFQKQIATMTVTFSEPVVVTGAPRLQIQVGATSHESGERAPPANSPSTTVSFVLAANSGDEGALTITGPIVLHGGTITGVDGAPAALSFPAVSAPGVIIDVVAPLPPVVTAIYPASPTTVDKITVAGTAEPRAIVEFAVDDGARVETPVDENGRWAVAIGPFAAGAHTFRATAWDAANNPSGFTSLLPTRYDFTVTAGSTPPGRLANVSARLRVDESDAEHPIIAGFVVSGSGEQRMLVRGVGPTLIDFGVQAPLANPRLRLFDASGRVLRENDDWSAIEVAATAKGVGAFDLKAGSRDAALVQLLPPGAYSVQVLGNGGGGIALAEVFAATLAGDPPSPELKNLSTRGYVGTGEAQLVVGFVIGGTEPMRVLLRGVGPGLTPFGVKDVLADPTLTLYQTTAALAQNDDWEVMVPGTYFSTMGTAAEIAAAATGTGAFALPSGGRDAALLLTLPPGPYTAVVKGANGGTGTALVEVYVVK